MLVGVVSHAQAIRQEEVPVGLGMSEVEGHHHHHHHGHAHNHHHHHHHSHGTIKSYVIVKPDDRVKIIKKTQKGLQVVKGGNVTKADKKAIRTAEEDVHNARPVINMATRAYLRKLAALRRAKMRATRRRLARKLRREARIARRIRRKTRSMLRKKRAMQRAVRDKIRAVKARIHKKLNMIKKMSHLTKQQRLNRTLHHLHSEIHEARELLGLLRNMINRAKQTISGLFKVHSIAKKTQHLLERDVIAAHKDHAKFYRAAAVGKRVRSSIYKSIGRSRLSQKQLYQAAHKATKLMNAAIMEQMKDSSRVNRRSAKERKLLLELLRSLRM